MASIPVSVVAGTTQLLAAPANNTRYKILNFLLVSTLAGTVQFKSGTNVLTGSMSLAANGVLTSAPTSLGAAGTPGQFETNSAEALNITTSGAVEGYLNYQAIG